MEHIHNDPYFDINSCNLKFIFDYLNLNERTVKFIFKNVDDITIHKIRFVGVICKLIEQGKKISAKNQKIIKFFLSNLDIKISDLIPHIRSCISFSYNSTFNNSLEFLEKFGTYEDILLFKPLLSKEDLNNLEFLEKQRINNSVVHF